MTIISIHFLFFVIAVLGVYYLLPRRLQNYWLLITSYVFYLTWAWEFALTLSILTITSYFLGIQLGAQNRASLRLLWLGIIVNVFTLLFFRLNGFFLPELLTLLKNIGIHLQTDSLPLFLPIGLSFYILQNISYLVDVSKKQIPPSNNIFDFALYLAYFPKLLAGPIERARTFMPKLQNPRFVDENVLARSAVLIVIGLFRKVFIADSLLSGTPNRILEQAYNYGALELSAWLVLYAFAIYNDFAGYTSIVRGISGLFGIELSPNFNFPYFSRNFAEFWSRWHMTLSQWLRDYIYFPLTRTLMAHIPNRQNLILLIVPPLVTMIVSGLWHGISWNLLIWGALYGVYLAVERVIALRRSGLPAELTSWRQGFGMLLTFGLVTLAWVPFRLEIPYAFHYWLGLLKWGNLEIVYWRELTIGLMFLISATLLEWLQWRYQDEVFILRWPRFAQAFVFASVIFMIFMASSIDGGPPFVYQNF